VGGTLLLTIAFYTYKLAVSQMSSTFRQAKKLCLGGL
jgi:hypothetical protein